MVKVLFTSVKLGEVLGVDLVSICEPGFPVAHFNSASESITDVHVRGVRLCRGTNILRKQLKMKIIFKYFLRARASP